MGSRIFIKENQYKRNKIRIPPSNWTAELKNIELAINENDAPWEDFFVADKKGRKWHGWRIHHALTIDGQTIEVIIPHGDISKLKFVLRGG